MVFDAFCAHDLEGMPVSDFYTRPNALYRGSRLVRPGLSLLLLVSLHSMGCLWVDFVGQAISGQVDLMTRGQPIDELVLSPSTPDKLKRWLSEVKPIKEFAGERGLRISSNYERYIELEEDSVIWLVTASKPFEFSPKVWDFPIAGSFPYQGWFDLADAQKRQEALSEQGWDAYIRGASAYSTLGWFSDPLLSSMIDRGGAPIGRLVNTVLHESVHATIYVPGQGHFNESVATFIGDALTPVYLEERFGPNAPETRRYRRRVRRAELKRRHIRQAFDELSKLFGSKIERESMRQKKEAIYQDLAEKLGSSRELNNGFLVDFQTYRADLASLSLILENCENNWPNFIRFLRTIKSGDFLTEQTKDLGPFFTELAQQNCRVESSSR